MHTRITLIAGIFFFAVSLGLLVWMLVSDDIGLEMLFAVMLALGLGAWFVGGDDEDEDDGE